MSDFQFFFIPCHANDAVPAASPDCHQLPHRAQLFVEMQPALDALHANPAMMTDPCLIELIIDLDKAQEFCNDGKLQLQSEGLWTVDADAEEEFMNAQAWVRVLPHPAPQPAPGDRATLWAAFAREEKGRQEGAWSFAMRLGGNDAAACADPNFGVRVFAEREQAVTALLKNGMPKEEDDVAIIALEVLKENAKTALGVVSRFKQGYQPSAAHLQTLVEQAICMVEFLKPAQIAPAV